MGYGKSPDKYCVPLILADMCMSHYGESQIDVVKATRYFPDLKMQDCILYVQIFYHELVIKKQDRNC